MVLVVIPGSARGGSIVVAILTILQFVFLIYVLLTELQNTAFLILAVVFFGFGVLASLCLIVGAIRVSYFADFKF